MDNYAKVTIYAILFDKKPGSTLYRKQNL